MDATTAYYDAEPQHVNADPEGTSAANDTDRPQEEQHMEGEATSVPALEDVKQSSENVPEEQAQEVNSSVVNDDNNNNNNNNDNNDDTDEPTFPEGLVEAAATAAALAQQPLTHEKPGVDTTLSVADPTRALRDQDDLQEQHASVVVKVGQQEGPLSSFPLFAAVAQATPTTTATAHLYLSPVENPVAGIPSVGNPVAGIPSDDGGGVPPSPPDKDHANPQPPHTACAAAAAVAYRVSAGMVHPDLGYVVAAASSGEQHQQHQHHTAFLPSMIPHRHMAIPVTFDTSTDPPTIKLANNASPPTSITNDEATMGGVRTSDLPVPKEDEVDLSSFPYEVNLGKDVVSGKGGKVQQVNRHFRNLVAAEYPQYDSTSSKISKRKIGLKIYQEVIDRGGKFLDHDGNVMDQPKAVLKVMKALKDAKTWTSDAKRLAKRRREESGTADTTKKNMHDMPSNKRARKTAPTKTPPATEHVKEEDEEGQDGSGLALLYQAIDGDNIVDL